jgi:2-phosphosulfolactate phosphatase
LAITMLAPADITIVVDVLTFSTCVDIATSRGAAVLPHPWNDSTAAEFALAHGAQLAKKRGTGRYSLAPESFLEASAGLRVVLPSPNGARISLDAAVAAPILLSGCLRNAAAVAEVARRSGSTFNVLPAGERWPDGSLRPALEDWLGAGAILSSLPGLRSPEAEAAVALFEHYHDSLFDVLATCSSGRELAERGHLNDKVLAGDLNASQCVPRFDGVAFVAA